MTLKQLLVVLGINLALIIGVFAVRFMGGEDSQLSPESRRGEKVFEELNTDQVDSITIVSSDHSVNLKKDGETWKVEERDSFPAQIGKIESLLEEIASLKITETVEIEDKYLDLFDLKNPQGKEKKEETENNEGNEDNNDAEDTGTHLILSSGGKVVADLLIGAAQEDEASVGGKTIRSIFLIAKGQEGVQKVSKEADTPPPNPMGFSMSPLLSWLRFDSNPKDWISDDFFNVSNAVSVEVTHPVAEDSWKAIMGKPEEEGKEGEWELVDPEEGTELDLDSKAYGLRRILMSPRFLDIVPKDETGDINWENSITAVVKTSDNFTYQLEFVKEDEEDDGSNYYLKVDISADIAQERPAVEGESDEEKQQNDARFQIQLRSLNEKLEEERRFNGSVYIVSEFTLSTLLKPKAELTKKIEPEEPETTDPDPDTPAPTDPGTTEPDPDTPTPTDPGTSEPEPDTPTPSDPGTSEPDPDTPAPTDPGTTELDPDTPAPTDPGTSEPEPDTPTPSDPGTTESEPDTPAPTDPGTTESEPDTPAPTDPGTTEPEPDTPPPSDPGTTEPEPDSPAPADPGTSEPEPDSSSEPATADSDSSES